MSNWRKMGVVCSLVAGVAAWPLSAQTPQAMFLGIPVKPVKGVYLVLKDVNVRAKPATRGRRLGRVEKGTRVEAVGRGLKGPWLAIRSIPDSATKTGGKDLGFVYEPIMMPIIDGTLNKDLTGRLPVGRGPGCGYVISFEDKSEALGMLFKFADYSVQWTCTSGGRDVRFATPMFITEGPHVGTRNPIHQITVDIPNLENGHGPEDVFSTHMLWDRGKGRVRFDSANIEKLVRIKTKAKTKPEATATELPAALRAALQLAHDVWTGAVWRVLMAGENEDRN